MDEIYIMDDGWTEQIRKSVEKAEKRENGETADCGGVMTYDEIRRIVDELIAHIQTLPDGTITTTTRLLRNLGYDPGSLEVALFEIHKELFKDAEGWDIYLDMSRHAGLVEGLPYDLDFVICHNTPTYWYCSVAVKDVLRPYSYISDDGEIEPGTYVEVPFGNKDKPRIGIVKACAPYRKEEVPYPVSQTKHISRISTREEYDTQGELEPYRWGDYDPDPIQEVNDLIEDERWEEVYEWAKVHEETDNAAILKKVVECYELASMEGIEEASLDLGSLYYFGRIVEQDYKKAFRYYKEAADAGNVQAICNCGYCFYYGRHQEVDYAEAYKYFSRGAMVYNDPTCLYKVGDHFLNGYAVEKNGDHAFLLYQRAYDICRTTDDSYSTPDIQFRIGKCLLYGLGTAKNVMEANTMLSVALENYYKRRNDDPFNEILIKRTLELIVEAHAEIDKLIAGEGKTKDGDKPEKEGNFEVMSPIPIFSKYLELIFAKDELWDNFQTYVRQSMPYRGNQFFEYHRDPECIEIWRQMLENMGGGFPLSLFASASFLLLAYRDKGHDLDAELEELHRSNVQ